MNFKKAFTLIELIIVMIIVSLMGTYAYNTIKKNNFYSALTTLQKTMKHIINNGILSPTGYPSAKGGSCSENYDFIGLNAKNLIECTGFNEFDVTGTGKSSNFTSNSLMADYGSCNIYLNDFNNSRNSFEIYVDCNEIFTNYGIRYASQVEEALTFTFEQEFSNINPHVTNDIDKYNVLPIGVETSSEDGILQVRFEL